MRLPLKANDLFARQADGKRFNIWPTPQRAQLCHLLKPRQPPAFAKTVQHLHKLMVCMSKMGYMRITRLIPKSVHGVLHGIVKLVRRRKIGWRESLHLNFPVVLIRLDSLDCVAQRLEERCGDAAGKSTEWSLACPGSGIALDCCSLLTSVLAFDVVAAGSLVGAAGSTPNTVVLGLMTGSE